MVKIAKGLASSFKNFINISVDEALHVIQRRKDCYEVLEEVNRVYGDIDGKPPFDITEEEFNTIDEQTKNVIETFMNDYELEYSLMTASSYEHRKISWRFVLTEFIAEKRVNKEFVKTMNLALPKYVTIDTGVYGKNQKMRMLNSNKDGQTRPLKLIKGEDIDTFISYIPEGCKTMEMPEKEKEEKKVKKEKVKENSILSELLFEVSVERLTEYDSWIQCGMICFNEEVSVNVWDNASQRATNYSKGECEKKWKTFNKGALGIATLWKWLKEDNPTAYDKLRCYDYQYVKEEFEKTHFKLMNPSVFGRIDGLDIQFKTTAEMVHCYKNKFIGKERFLELWTSDETIKTYQRLTFQPMKDVPDDEFNLFNGYPIEPKEGDISVVHEVLQLLSNFNQEHMNYIEDYFAHMLQKPYEKPGVALVFQSEEKGIGKDTYVDFVGSILTSQYFFNTAHPENDVFSRFNGCIEKSILIKFEEANFETNKANVDGLKTLITAPTFSYTRKGHDSIQLPSYCRIIMTTNNFVPVVADSSERRFAMFQVNPKRKGQLDWWADVHETLSKLETKQAYMYYLMNRDISKFNPRRYPETDYHKDVKQSLAPYHAKFFCYQSNTLMDGQTKKWEGTELCEEMNSNSKFTINLKRFGTDMKQYIDAGALYKGASNGRSTYTMKKENMKQYLESRGWWYDV